MTMVESGFIVEMTVHLMIFCEVYIFGFFYSATFHRLGTSWMKVTAGRRIEGGGDIASQYDPLAPVPGIQRRLGGQQSLGVWVGGFPV